ncbi:hypothetical protein [Thiomicrospira microaerophila]|uniref:hypothetical protein n=1 Tax=Thiomicrospira microaerophila TaxID=406020 RepID=UPI0005CAB47E|nr:hypothetical protein [Thiomicrospira microaerophila]
MKIGYEIALKKTNVSDTNFWREFTDIHLHKKKDLEALKVFIQAPDNGYLLVTILSNFIELGDGLEKGVPKYDDLSAFISTAKWMLVDIKSRFTPENDSYAHLYFDAYIEKVSQLNHIQISEQQDWLTPFIHGSLLHGYKKKNAIYTCLFFPFITDPSVLTENASLTMTLKVHEFIKAQAFKLLASITTKLSEKTLYDFSSSLIKIITLNQYDHLNITGYELMDSPAKIYFAILKGTHDDDEHFLEDKTKRLHRKKKKGPKSLDADENETASREGIERAKQGLLQFFARFFRLKKPKKQNEKPAENSERGEYNRKMGLVILDKTLKEKYTYSETDVATNMSGNPAKIRSLRIPRATAHRSSFPSEYSEYGDDIDAETETIELNWLQLPPCEINNPIAKLIHTKRIAPHIALANQGLQYRLASNHVNGLIKHIQIIVNDIDYNGRQNYNVGVRKNLLSLLISLLFGRHFKAVMLEHTTENQILGLSDDCSKARLVFPHYHNEHYLAHSELYRKASVTYVELILPEQLKSYLSVLITSLRQDDLIKSNRISLPDKKTVKNYLASHFNNQIDLARLIDAVTRSYSNYSNSDSWMMAIFSGNEVGLQKTQKHYASSPLRKTQAIFEKHCASLFGIKVKHYVGFNRVTHRIGSPYYLNIGVFNEIVTSLYKLSEPLNGSLRFNISKLEEVVVRFNALAIYIDLFCAFSCAIRNVYDPSVDIGLVSEQGLFRVNDKNIHDGFNTRMTYVPPNLKQALKQYKRIRRIILVALVKEKLVGSSELALTKKNNLIFFVINAEQGVQINRYARTASRDELYSQSELCMQLERGVSKLNLLKHLKTNVNRHYLRGRLLELNVPGHYIDAYLGHWHLGTQPWGQMSLFDQKDYIEKMSQTIPVILDELGFKAFSQDVYQQ